MMNKLNSKKVVEQQVMSQFCKYFKNNKKIYAHFVDLRKAFDSVVHPALLHKLLTYGIGRMFYNIIASMYENNVLQVKTGSAMLTDKVWLQLV